MGQITSASTAQRCWCGGAVARVFEQGEYRTICMDSSFHDPTADGRPGKVRKLYVAGPMSGYKDNNYPLFARVSADLRRLGYEVVNPAEYGEGRHYVDFLREDLRFMLDCQGVAVLDNWWESIGARNEVSVAGLLKMPVRPWQEWTHRVKAELG